MNPANRTRLFLLICLVSALLPCVVGAEENKTETRMRKDLFYLASDECEGRGVGTKGINLAADYIAGEFKKAGLQPGGKEGSYFQPFTIKGNLLEGTPRLTFRGPQGQEIGFSAGEHFEPHGFSQSGKIDQAPLVFVGYGLTVRVGRSTDVIYDDFAGVDIKGKVVVMLRATPRDDNNEDLPFGWSKRQKAEAGSLQTKFENAEKNGAVAVLLVNDRVTATGGDELSYFSMGALQRVPAKFPVFHVARTQIEEILQSGTGRGLKQLEQGIERDLKPNSLPVNGWKVSGEIKVSSGIPAKNVVGVLPGAGPLAGETIIVGAHYDHLGYGGSSSLAGLRKPAIHHGADDNGSGSTALLELARRFGAVKNRQGRQIVFMTFSGEEIALLGSAHYCQTPLFPLKDTAAMVNLDMVGRLTKDQKSGKNRLLVQGSGTSKGFNDLLDRLNKKYDFDMKKSASGFGPSDHASFNSKKIPVLFFWTGDHSDYHRPTDLADRINYGGMEQIVSLTEEVVTHLTTVTPRPEYTVVPGGSSRGGARFGIRFAEDDKTEGAVVEGTVPESPAEKATLKPKDRIIELAGKPVKSAEAFLTSSRDLEPGKAVEFTVLRGTERLKLSITPVSLPVIGMQPDYSDETAGILLKGVGDGSAAQKGGLKGGDRILELNGKTIKDLEAYMDLLYTVKPGQPMDLTVLRDGKKTTVKVVPE